MKCGKRGLDDHNVVESVMASVLQRDKNSCNSKVRVNLKILNGKNVSSVA